MDVEVADEENGQMLQKSLKKSLVWSREDENWYFKIVMNNQELLIPDEVHKCQTSVASLLWDGKLVALRR